MMSKLSLWELEKNLIPKKSRNPEVCEGTLEEDQNRRDFTINALALSLNKEDFGLLLDPFGGISDMESKILKTTLRSRCHLFGRSFAHDASDSVCDAIEFHY